MPLGMALKFYTSVAKGSKLNVRKFWGLIPTFVEIGETDLGLTEFSICRLNQMKREQIPMKV